jgi:hypothetical protein
MAVMAGLAEQGALETLVNPVSRAVPVVVQL